MLKGEDALQLLLYTVSLIFGAVLSLVMPVKGIASVLCAIIAVDIYLSYRLKMRRKKVPKSTSVPAGLFRGADYLATLVVVNMFQASFMPQAPLVYIAGVGLGLFELKRINRKLVLLHTFGALGPVLDRLMPKDGNRTGSKGSD